jgi:hypothetical protein
VPSARDGRVSVEHWHAKRSLRPLLARNCLGAEDGHRCVEGHSNGFTGFTAALEKEAKCAAGVRHGMEIVKISPSDHIMALSWIKHSRRRKRFLGRSGGVTLCLLLHEFAADEVPCAGSYVKVSF